MLYRTLNHLDVAGKTVLVRTDFNVPLRSGQIAEDTRIVSHIDTLMELIERGAKVIVCSHMGKASDSLSVVAEHLRGLLPVDVTFSPKVIGPEVDMIKATLQEGEILLLENTRSLEGEKKNDPDLAKELAKGVDIFINDAFAAAHRAHASTVGVAEHVKEKGIGRLMEKEVSRLGQILDGPKKPLLVIIGGRKVSSKLGVLKNLIQKADQILIGGAMANTFLAAMDNNIGTSLHEENMIDEAKEIMKEAALDGCHISLPRDVIIASSLEEGAQTESVKVSEIPEDKMVLDVGLETRTRWHGFINKAKTILWNGPVGAFEVSPFDAATDAIALSIAESSAYSVIGGGDTLSAIQNTNIHENIDYISTAGGAMLSFLEGKKLPALKVLEI